MAEVGRVITESECVCGERDEGYVIWVSFYLVSLCRSYCG